MNAESEADRTLRNLSVVAQVKQNDKLTTLGDTFEIYPPTVLRGACRKWSGETRDGNLQRIQELINSACAYITHTTEKMGNLDSVTKNHLQRKCARVMIALDKCRVGLTNLSHTYIDDTTCCVKIKLLVQTIEDFLEVVNHNHVPEFELSSGVSCTRLL